MIPRFHNPNNIGVKNCNTSNNTNNTTYNLKTSIYDWDSPSSYTGTVKRRPNSNNEQNNITNVKITKSSPILNTITPSIENKNIQKNNKFFQQKSNSIRKKIVNQQEIIISGNCCQPIIIDALKNETSKRNQHPNDESQLSRPIKLTNKLRNSVNVNKLIDNDKEIPLLKMGLKFTASVSKSSSEITKKKCETKIPLKYFQTTTTKKMKQFERNVTPDAVVYPSSNRQNNYQDDCNNMLVREPFRKCYSSTEILSVSLKKPPVYRNPPTPPPISRMPNRKLYNDKPTKQVKENSKEFETCNPDKAFNRNYQSDDEDIKSQMSIEKSPYKKHVTDFKKCLTRGLFSLSSSSSSSSSSSTPIVGSKLSAFSKQKSMEEEELTNYVICNSTKYSPDDTLTKPKFTSSFMINIPVRPRKGGIPHLDNYCLFDPTVDFINEKDIKKSSSNLSRIDCIEQNDKFVIKNDDNVKIYPKENYDNHFNDELTNKIIYVKNIPIGQEIEMTTHDQDKCITNYSHHNYFSIDPDDFQFGKIDQEFNVQPIEHGKKHDDFNEQPSEHRKKDMSSIDNDDSVDLTIESSLLETILLDHIGHENNVTDNLVSDDKNVRLIDLSLPLESNLFITEIDLYQYRNRIKSVNLQEELNNSNMINKKNAKYKVEKASLLSSYSNFDDCIIKISSPEELKFDQFNVVQGSIEIYTDWANYYLERAKSKKRIKDLSVDCRDGLTLAEIIEAVTLFKVPDLIKKPKNQQQMFENVKSCLTILQNHSVGGLETITVNEIYSGNLKSVLELFFALSKYKQQAKKQKNVTGKILAKTETSSSESKLHQQQFHQLQQNTEFLTQQNSIVDESVICNGDTEMIMKNRQIPLPYSKTNGNTSIPLPATVQVQRRCPPDKVRPLPPTPNHVPSIPGLGKTGNSTCVENTSNHHQQNSTTNTNQHQNSTQSPQKGNNNGLRQPQSKIPTSPVHQNQQNGIITQPLQQSSPVKNQNTIVTNAHTKHSMLDRLKLFHHKEKSSSSSISSASTSTKSIHVSKRTSSSSGFSSARSERSDSSLSINDGHSSHIKSNNITNNTNTIGRTKTDNNKNSKQTKLFSSSNLIKSTKDSTVLATKKDNKKEKSPARIKNDIQHQVTDTKLGQQRINTKNISTHLTDQQQKCKMSSKLTVTNNSKSVIKNNLVMPTPQTKTLVSTVITATGNITNIPKPMAAIKGTSKNVSTVDKPQQTDMTPMMKKLEKKSIITNNHQGIISNETDHKNLHISNTVIVPNMSTGNINNFSTDKNNVINKQDITTRISIGNSIHSSSSAFYRPGSITNHNQQIDLKELILNVQHNKHNQTVDMIHQNGHPNGKKYNTVPNKIIGTIYEEEPKLSSDNVMPMRPLLRGYNSHVTLPTRSSNSNKNYLNDFCESDIGQGYCSDSDSFRHNMTTNNSSSRFIEIDNGYLSEGSGGGGGTGTNGRVRHGKHFLSVMRKRIQLPTTIEERIRGSHGSLDSICTAPAIIESPTSITKTSPTKKMDIKNNDNQDIVKNFNHSSSQQNNSIDVESNGSLDGAKKCDIWEKNHNNEQQNDEKSSPISGNKEISSKICENISLKESVIEIGNTMSSGKIKGVPQSFGYVKRTNSSQTGTIISVDQQGKTAHVSALPRSDNIFDVTQTFQNDMTGKILTNPQHRSFSLTGPGATQLSQSIRERLSTGSHSLPKHGIDIHSFQHRIFNRSGGKLFDGSLSDTQTYAEVKSDYSPYSMWLKESRNAANRLCNGDGQNYKLINRNAETTNMIQSPRMNRSSSIRSTKSEKSYPSIMANGSDAENEPFYCLPVGTIQNGRINFGTGTVVAVPWSQPTSPTPLHNRGPISPTLNISNTHRLTYPKKNDEVHGSATSLLSGGSSLYGSVEERQANEVRRLKRELTDARDQVMSLSSQLSTNAHVVAAFEQSLANMTTRLQQLTATAERKDGELTDMRQTIELLRKQSIQAGLTSAHMQSMGVQKTIDNQIINSSINNQNSNSSHNLSPARRPAQNSVAGIQQQHSSDSMNSLNSISSGCSGQDKKKKKGWLRSSFTKAFSRNAKIAKTNRNVDVTNDQNLTVNSNTDLQSISKNSTLPPQSPTKRNLQKPVTIVDNAKPVDAIELESNPMVENLKKQLREKDLVLTDIRLEALSSASQLESLKETVMKMRTEMLNLKQNNERLQKLVTSRSLAGSDLSLGNSTSPSGSLSETRRYSLADGNTRPPMDLPRGCLQEEEVEEENLPPAPAPEPPPSSLSPTTHIDLTPPPPAIEPPPSPSHMSINVGNDDIPDPTEGKKISIAVYLGQPESFTKYLEEIYEYDISLTTSNTNQITKDINIENSKDDDLIFKNITLNEYVIAYTYISGKTSWQNLDYIVRKTFKDYVSRIDPGTNLGLNTDSITSYHLGEAKRGPEIGFPELLPCGYIIGNVKSLYICLQGVGSLAFDSLIPRSIVHRYISLLTEHRRLILCGPSGTGKSYLARKLAEFLVARSGRGNPSEAIATFNVDHKSSKDLRQFLGLIAEQASISNGSSELPSVIILDNLHHASALGDVFSGLLSSGPAAKLPCIIGTMSQATCNTTNLQLHHNFRWVLTANHMEPVKGFLGRFLRRRVFTLELQTQNHKPELTSVLAWLSNIWQHINRFLENHSSSDVTIGPRLFLSCPLDLKDSQVWFTDVWNYHLAPYIIDAVREGVQLYGRRGGSWNDPSEYIRDSYPWPYGPDSVPPLRQINAEDVGLESESTGSNDSHDPLLNMLIHLQEAANYSGVQENESDCVSLDSNITAES